MQPSTRDRIRTAATALSAERGLDAVSVRDIAAAVGMKPSNLYAHYPSRDALIAELFADGYAEYGALLAEAAAGPGPFAVRLRAMVRLICRLHDEDTTRFRFLLLAQHGQLARVGDAVETPVTVLQREVEAAMGRGEIAPGDPALLTAAIVGIPLQAATFHLYGRLQRSLDELADDIADACLAVVTPVLPGAPPHER